MEKKNTYIIFAIVILLALFSAWNLFGSRGTDLPNIRNTINEVGDNIQSAGQQLDTIGQGIDESQQRVETIEAGNSRIEESINQLTEYNKSSQELISQGKSILRDIRTGNQSGTAQSENKPN